MQLKDDWLIKVFNTYLKINLPHFNTDIDKLKITVGSQGVREEETMLYGEEFEQMFRLEKR